MYDFAHLANEGKHLSFHDELMEARQDISRLRGEIHELQTLAEIQHREHKYMLKMLERMGFLHRKKPVLVVRPKATDVKSRMSAHLTWQFNRICVA